jgi:alkylation response protein AidB-like acyl-CoA dehydrogenase
MTEPRGVVSREEARSVVRDVCAEIDWQPRDLFDPRGRANEATQRAFYLGAHERGWGVPAWPSRYGGSDRTFDDQAIFHEEAIRFGAPAQYNRVALGIVGPALLEFGSTEQKDRFLPAIANGSEVWCQGFSEPDAGSDLGSLRTRAIPSADGTDEWIISGQKTWTTLAHSANWCFLLARTGTREMAHRGITALLVPMHQPGVTVRPIRQLTGESDFNEVFFDEARAHAPAELGPVNGGWPVAMRALEYERSLHFLERQLRLEALARRLVSMTSGVEDASSWPAVLEVVADCAGLRYAVRDFLGRVAAGKRPGTEINGTKVLWSETYRALTRLGLCVAAAAGDDAEFAGWSEAYYGSLAATIYGGTNEIQRDIIAERGLGLIRTR